jgi:hypothetical protein
LVFDSSSHEIKVRNGFLTIGLVSRYQDFVETRIDHLTTKVLELMQELEEILFHELVNQTVE